MAQVIDNTRLFRGQGQVFLAERSDLGKPLGFEFVGNVSELKIEPKTEAITHKESQTGDNSVDAKIEKGLEISVSYNTCSSYKENLKRLLFAKLTEVASGTSVSGEPIIAYLEHRFSI